MSKKNEQQPEAEVTAHKITGAPAQRLIKLLDRAMGRAGSTLSITRHILRDPIGFGVEYGKLQMRHAAKAQRAGELRKELRMLRNLIRDRDRDLDDLRAARNEDRRRIVELQRAITESSFSSEDKAAVAGLAANLRNGADGQALPAQGGE